MSQYHSTSKGTAEGVPRRSATTSRLLGTPKWFLAEAIVAACGVVALVINVKLMSWLARDANGR